MDLSLNETQQMLKNTAKDFFTSECPETHVREMETDQEGYNKQLWEKIVNQGWLGVPFPEKYGGFGLSFLEFCILLEEAGRVLLPEPLFESVLLGGMPIFISGNEKQKEELLPKVISGESIITLAFYEEDDLISPLSVQTQVSLNNKPLNLSRREITVLETLLQQPGRVVTAAQLQDRLYGWTEGIESNAVAVHIHNLRRKLGDDWIETVRGMGYRLGAVNEPG